MGLAAATFTGSNGYLWYLAQKTFSPETSADPLIRHDPSIIIIDPAQDSERPVIVAASSGDLANVTAGHSPRSTGQGAVSPVVSVADKVRNFENEFSDDVYLDTAEHILMLSVLTRLKRVEQTIGHGNYNVVGFDEVLKHARYQSHIGRFSATELDFIDKIFNTAARDYGFYGEKVTTELTAKIKTHERIKIPYTGHYLLKDTSLAHYEKLKKAVGRGVILTSGIRSNVKQMHLFLAKAVASNYNLSKASRSLAPPGHSFHGVGDYDVGKMGWGVANFTQRFETTDEFKRMQDLGYIQIRYTKDNRLGVRFEPWHIKVV